MIIKMDFSLRKGERVKSIECPIITEDNSILLKKDTSPDYREHFNLCPIDSGLIMHDNRFFVFLHNILTTPRGYFYGKSKNESWDVFEITNELAKKFISNGFVSNWEARFNCWINFNRFYNWVSHNGVVTIEKYKTRVDGDTLYVNGDKLPSSLNELGNIEDWIDSNNIEYGSSMKVDWVLNMPAWRDIVLDSLI